MFQRVAEIRQANEFKEIATKALIHKSRISCKEGMHACRWDQGSRQVSLHPGIEGGEVEALGFYLHIYATYCSLETHDRSRDLPMGDSTNQGFCITCLQACLLPDVSLNTTCSNCLIDQSLQVEKCRSWQDVRHVTSTICTIMGYVLRDTIYMLTRSNSNQNCNDLCIPLSPLHLPHQAHSAQIGLHKFHVKSSILSKNAGF